MLFSHNPKIIYSVDSPCSGTINVWEDRGSLTLEVGGYPQSVTLDAPGFSERYWTKAAEEVGKRLMQPKQALVIGVGGGTILHLLAKRFPDLALVGVELDPRIVEVARKYFGLDEIKNLSVVIGDGADYVRNHKKESFDLLFIDAYLGGNFPLHFEERAFLNKLRTLSAPAGLTVINRTSGSHQSDFANLLRDVFSKVEIVKIPLPGFLGGLGGNYLFFCND